MRTINYLIALFVLVQVFSHASGFIWNSLNVEELFQNSDQTFDTLAVDLDPSELPCLEQFKRFVDQSKTRQEWALSCK